MRIYEIFKNLAGFWNFQRDLRAKDTSQSLGTVHGSVSFSFLDKEASILHYIETGTWMRKEKEKFQVQQKYLYVYNPLKDEIQKYFLTRGLFYALSFQPSLASTSILKTAEGTHLCKRDLYQAQYHFLRNDRSEAYNKFTLFYNVTGPNKNYVSETNFYRKYSL